MWHTYYAPRSLPEALDLLARHGADCRVIAGGTDLILELERGVRLQKVLVDVSRIPGLDRVERSGEILHLGSTVTHNQVVASAEAVERAFPLARACWLVGAPQIRNRGTVAGNLVTASPANDTITPLWAMDARITLASSARGERTLTCDQFFQGVRRTDLAPDEMVVRISVPLLGPNERGTFLKLGLRQAQAISVANVAVLVEFAGLAGDQGVGTRDQDLSPDHGSPITRARIALGSVAPTIVRATKAELFLSGKALTEEVIARAAELTAAAAHPISDIRGSADYRRDMIRVLTARALRQLRDGTERADWPERPILLWGSAPWPVRGPAPFAGSHLGPRGAPSWPGRDKVASAGGQDGQPAGKGGGLTSSSQDVQFTLNGKPTVLRDVRGKTLLRALREDAGLTGTKEGCAEGECGACTVWLDGVAVMSCLVPVERADGCEVVTVEGLALPDGTLHPVQQGFVDAGAVQCGYCTPGLVMAAANLLREVPDPSQAQVFEALTGNLCRCTGYYRIIEAVERAAGTV